ncbi:hypothetical protein NC651_017786 [Populus alba x Populus x berolinensis]|nr:hypothetical protein NC651_017786 [Populus alba x Populus x berolinensis]
MFKIYGSPLTIIKLNNLLLIFYLFTPLQNMRQVTIHNFLFVLLVKGQFKTPCFFVVTVFWLCTDINPRQLDILVHICNYLIFFDCERDGILFWCLADFESLC